ncbi:MAG: polyprenyl synthetase family protein [Oscillospiraceae bacterium]|nr:polyprenyl synthetase family protein [Oscillospiraceae bacterium]
MKTSKVNAIIENRIRSSVLYNDIQTALEQMCERLEIMAKSAEAHMGSDLSELLNSGGKRLRPILAFVCSRFGEKQMDIVPLMCMLELMHTASLIHDDVVDGAVKRREMPTINKKRGDFAAVQSGDYLLAKAMELLHIYKDTGINEMLAEVSYQMTVGELSQQAVRYEFNKQSATQYYELINKKSALLIAASCGCGAIAGGVQSAQVGALYRYGQQLGMAFQLRDDLLDFSEQTGKAPGQDLKNGIFTLPILMLLESGVPEPVHRLLMKREKSDNELLSLIEYVKGAQALSNVEDKIKEHVAVAQKEIDIMQSGNEKKALKELAESLSDKG